MENFDDLLGLTLAEAEEVLEPRGLVIRVREEDGSIFFGTADYRLDRVNVALAEGKIVGTSGLG